MAGGPAVPWLPSFLIPTRKHFFRRQYWHWLRWCWSIWQSLLDLQGGGNGGAFAARCHRARPHSLLPAPPPPQTHTHTHTPAGRCYGNSAWELFATDRAESPSLQPFPWLWDCSHAVPTVQPGGPEGGGHSCGRNSSYFLWSCGTGLPGGLGPGGGQPHRVILGCERGRALGKRAEMGQLPQVPKAQRYPQPRLQETPGGAR